jgi:DNA polymerase III delta subunit
MGSYTWSSFVLKDTFSIDPRILWIENDNKNTNKILGFTLFETAEAPSYSTDITTTPRTLDKKPRTRKNLYKIFQKHAKYYKYDMLAVNFESSLQLKFKRTEVSVGARLGSQTWVKEADRPTKY